MPNHGSGRGRPVVRLVALGVVLLGVGILAQLLRADGGSDSARHEAERFSFSYPAGWERIEGEQPVGIDDSPDYGRHVFGADRDHLVVVAYLQDLPDTITERNVDQLIPGYRRIFARFTKGLAEGGRDARIVLAPTVTEAAGLPAVESRMTSLDERDRMIRTRSITIYRGPEQYVVGCRRPVEVGSQTRAADRGCEQVLETLEIEGDGR